VRKLTTLEKSKEPTADVIAGLTGQGSLAGCDGAPENHLNWNPNIWSQFLANHLRGQLCEQERTIEYRLPIVVVVGGESEIS
jgi:hypothetical protein